MLKDHGLQVIRAKKVIQMRVDGMTKEEVAEHFGCHVRTIERILKFAHRQNLLSQIEDKLHEELMPKAHQSLVRALDNEEDGAVALELYKGTGVLTKQSKKQSPVDQAVEDEDLAAYLRSHFDGFDEGQFTEVIDGEPKSLPPAEQTSVVHTSTNDGARVEKTAKKGRPRGSKNRPKALSQESAGLLDGKASGTPVSKGTT